MGTILGAYITKSGGQVDLVNHNAAHVAALKKNGAKVVGTVNFIQAVNAVTTEEMNGKYDCIILLT